VRLAEFLLVMKIAQLDVIFSKHFNWSAAAYLLSFLRRSICNAGRDRADTLQLF
jgi:hypothetical protein